LEEDLEEELEEEIVDSDGRIVIRGAAVLLMLYLFYFHC